MGRGRNAALEYRAYDLHIGFGFRSRMPVGRWADLLRSRNIPTMVSYHAGTFLCNATMYLSHAHYGKDPSAPFIGFIHLPLTTEQVATHQCPSPSLTTEMMAKAVNLVLGDLVDWMGALPAQKRGKQQVV